MQRQMLAILTGAGRASMSRRPRRDLRKSEGLSTFCALNQRCAQRLASATVPMLRRARGQRAEGAGGVHDARRRSRSLGLRERVLACSMPLSRSSAALSAPRGASKVQTSFRPLLCTPLQQHAAPDSHHDRAQRVIRGAGPPFGAAR